MPAQAVLGSRASCQTHFPQREGESLELPLLGLRDHGLQLPQHPREHRAQQATTAGAFHDCVPWMVHPLRAGRLHPPLMACLQGSIGVIARLCAYFCARMCLKETIIINEQLRA